MDNTALSIRTSGMGINNTEPSAPLHVGKGTDILRIGSLDWTISDEEMAALLEIIPS